MTSRRARKLGIAASCLGIATLLAAAIWWWLVFRQIIVNAYMSAPRALPCMVGESVVCRLAQALCTSDHFLGIRRYHAEIFWIGASLIAAGIVVRGLTRVSIRDRPLLAGGE